MGDKSTMDERRLWLGNLDSRVNEYQLLKLTQKFGKIEKFDLLYHRNGPQANQPRGYAFVTYERKQDALEAKIHLDQKLVGTKNISVTWAHCIPAQTHLEKAKKEVNIPALAIATSKGETSKDKQIKAIEAKLNMMSRKSTTELVINKTVATELPVIIQAPKDISQTKPNPHRHKPYERNRPTRRR